MVRIGFGMRLLAGLIDCAIMLCVGFALNMIILGVMGRTTTGLIVVGTMSCLAGLAYSTFEIFRAASPGKMLLKYQITTTDGGTAPRDVLIKRWALKQTPIFLYLLSAVTTLSIFGMLGLVVGLAFLVGCFLALQPEKLAFHDKLLGTAVHGPATFQVGFPATGVMTPAPVRATVTASEDR